MEMPFGQYVAQRRVQVVLLKGRHVGCESVDVGETKLASFGQSFQIMSSLALLV